MQGLSLAHRSKTTKNFIDYSLKIKANSMAKTCYSGFYSAIYRTKPPGVIQKHGPEMSQFKWESPLDPNSLGYSRYCMFKLIWIRFLSKTRKKCQKLINWVRPATPCYKLRLSNRRKSRIADGPSKSKSPNAGRYGHKTCLQRATSELVLSFKI